MRKRMILLRFDDICDTMNWTQWHKAKELLDNTGVKALLGVIPDCGDDDLAIDPPRKDFWAYIKSLQIEGYTIAMHGLYHVFDTEAKGIVTKKKRSEFAGHSYSEQYNKIRKGKEIFESHEIKTDIFFAPAHSYDDNTLKALAANGFKYISDGFSDKPYKRHGVICIPCRSAGVPKIKEEGNYTVVLHAHEWVRPEKSKAWKDLCNICDKYKKDILTFPDYCNSHLGNAFFQRINEWVFFMWSAYIKPPLSKIRRLLMK